MQKRVKQEWEKTRWGETMKKFYKEGNTSK